jgi:hypothetical protein
VNGKQEKECGTCFACCIWLGVQTLQKWPGQTCKHLDGADPTKRCSIYSNRPPECARYRCMWLNSDLPQEFKPENSGIIITPYPGDNGSVFCVLSVFDKKAGDWAKQGSLLHDLIRILLEPHTPPITAVRVVFRWTKKMIIFRDGVILSGELIKEKGAGVENLSYAEIEQPIGRCEIRRIDDNREAG